ncbi:flagellar biosynthesis protein FlgL [Salipiger sp. P9]|uniref:flagellin n=1 Tax=Salipiger pentaromativorans TaxID=2943193 RepID=UPI0021571E02|nr:flagellin [Salipiger pentaromativorans]MCR8549521.1 flagellar biosynthesis protein FlgL [Salipiger pentaromativorans]
MDTVGDLARTLVLRTHQTRLNRDLDRLGTEIATGFVSDPAAHLGGDVTALVAIDRSLAQLETYRVNTTEAAFLTGTMQTTLEEIQDRSEQLSQVLLSVELTPNEEMFQTLSGAAENALGQMVNGLNRSVAGRFLFSGTATDSPSVIDSDALIAELSVALAGQTTVAGIEAELDIWFDSAGGGFETDGYLGSDTALAPLQLSRTDSTNVDIRANDPVFRDMLKAVAKAALASDQSLALSDDVKTGLISNAALDLQTAQASMVELRAGLGALEQRIEETATRNSAERTATSLARLELVGTDEFETATRYENTRAQLETLYAITVRSSRLSLVEFLR